MDVQYSNESYCAICDMYFNTVQQRGEHVSNSPKHPRCETCDRRFLNKNILRNHFVYSRHHHYCASCRVSFETAAGLRMHIEYSAVHCDDSDDEEEGNTLAAAIEGREDELGELQYPDELEEDEEDGDDSWLHFDECDFEDEEDLGDIPSNEILSAAEEEEVDEGESFALSLKCPICQYPPRTTCLTICGHIFCGGCIRQMYTQQGVCPVCEEPGSMKQVRRLYIDV